MVWVWSVSTLVSTFDLPALPIALDRLFLTEVLLPRQQLRRDSTPMQLPRLHLPVVRMWTLLPRQHPTILVVYLSHWLQGLQCDPTPMQLPRLHLPVVRMWMLLPRQHPTILVVSSSHWLRCPQRDPTPMQLPRLHLPVVRMWMLLPRQHPTILVACLRLACWL